MSIDMSLKEFCCKGEERNQAVSGGGRAVRTRFISEGRNSIVLEGGAQWRGAKSTAQAKQRALLEQSPGVSRRALGPHMKRRKGYSMHKELQSMSLLDRGDVIQAFRSP